MKHKIYSAKEADIYYFISRKKDTEAILFLHPAFSDHTCFDFQIDFFSAYYTVITIDLLGHGLSVAGRSKEKIDKSAEHINEILIKEGIANVHIVGVSMGALIAQYFALLYPSKILSLSALGGYSINRIYPEIKKAQRKEMLHWLFKVIFSMNAFRRYVASVSVIVEKQRTLFYLSSKGFNRKSFMVMSGLDKVIAERDGYLRSYPLLILSGEKDNELALTVAKEWHYREQKSTTHIISNAGHCANMDNADEFNKILFDFISNKISQKK